MFGYIRPLKPELKIKEYEFYQAVYCGLCRANNKNGGCLHTLTLSYDYVFLSLLLFALKDEPLEVKTGRCALHPFRKRPYIAFNESLSRSASLSALLGYYKLRDDLADSRALKKFASLLLLPALSHAKKKAYSRNGSGEEENVKKYLAELAAIEKEKTPSVDRPAEVFGNLLASLIEGHARDEKQKTVAKEIAFHTGKWIYLCDALDDVGKDEKSGAYNPFLTEWKTEEETKKHAETIRTSLLHELDCVSMALDFLTCRDEGTRAVLFNIVHQGMPNETERILTKKE